LVTTGLALVLGACWLLLALRLQVHFSAWSFWQSVLAVLLSAVVHELLHGVVFPGGPFGPLVEYGSKCMLYFWATYDGEMRVRRRVFVKIMPVVMLTLLPLAWMLWTREAPLWLVSVAFLNLVGAGVDVVSIVPLVTQASAGGFVRDKGHESWWRPV